MLTLLTEVAALLASLVIAGWWSARLLTNLLFNVTNRDRIEDVQPWVGGPMAAVFGAGLTILAIALILHGTGAHWLSLPEGWPQQTLQHVVRVAAWIAGLAAAASGLAASVSATRAAGRRAMLLDAAQDKPIDVRPWPQGPPGVRSIVILCDGTRNRPDQVDEAVASPTNVYKLYRHLVDDETQVTFYQTGVGSDTSSTADQLRRTERLLAVAGASMAGTIASWGRRLLQMAEAAFGSNIEETIVAGYAEIVRRYQPGDRIYICGFSRGAYAARCIAGVITRCGLLRAENAIFAADVVRIYRNRPRQTSTGQVIRPSLRHEDPPIEFLGVFDTVASLGAPLWGWWFVPFPIWGDATTTEPAAACRHVYHALAMDERRSQFMPTLFTPRNGSDQVLVQTWFRGVHADIGGGYARTTLSDITLGWMMDAMARHGLRFRPGARKGLAPDPLARLHDELERQPAWRLLGSWPRWHLTPDTTPAPGEPTLHPTVLQRSAAIERKLGRYDLHLLQPGPPLRLVVEARREWNRTGLVIAQGAAYRLTWRGQRWTDGGTTPCSPFGQRAGLDARRVLGWRRRLPDEDWMRLVAHVAHPRPWRLIEKGLLELLSYLTIRDPLALRRQLAPIGRDMREDTGCSVVIRNQAPSGLLYLFANDWWQAANNNTGSVLLDIERLPDTEPVDAWTLGADGGWSPPTGVPPAPGGC